MTTLLQKYPWHAKGLYTLRDRNMLFAYLEQMAGQLVVNIGKQQPDGPFVTKLTQKVLTDLVHTACACGGLSSSQQARLVARTHHLLNHHVELHRLASAVPFEVLSIAYGGALGIQRELVEVGYLIVS
jgi:hypothetical protein